jgi:hypothetical protein
MSSHPVLASLAHWQDAISTQGQTGRGRVADRLNTLSLTAASGAA